jgi:hypothetical protein
MNTRPPVDLQRRCIEASTPGPQAVDRDVVRVGVILGRRSTPVQRLDVHCLERSDRLVVLVAAHRLARSLAPLACVLTRRFHRIQHLEPAVERPHFQRTEPTVFGAIDAAAVPRIDVNRPPCLSPFVLQILCSHRMSSRPRKNPILPTKALSNRRAVRARLRPAERLQDKSRDARLGRRAKECWQISAEDAMCLSHRNVRFQEMSARSTGAAHRTNSMPVDRVRACDRVRLGYSIFRRGRG